MLGGGSLQSRAFGSDCLDDESWAYLPLRLGLRRSGLYSVSQATPCTSLDLVKWNTKACLPGLGRGQGPGQAWRNYPVCQVSGLWRNAGGTQPCVCKKDCYLNCSLCGPMRGSMVICAPEALFRGVMCCSTHSERDSWKPAPASPAQGQSQNFRGHVVQYWSEPLEVF